MLAALAAMDSAASYSEKHLIRERRNLSWSGVFLVLAEVLS